MYTETRSSLHSAESPPSPDPLDVLLSRVPDYAKLPPSDLPPYPYSSPTIMVDNFERAAQERGIDSLRDSKAEMLQLTRIAHHAVSRTLMSKTDSLKFVPGIKPWRSIPYRGVDNAITYFFARYPQDSWANEDTRDTLNDYIRANVQIAGRWVEYYPETGDTVRMLTGCQKHNMEPAQRAVTILLAAYGERLRHVRLAAGRLVVLSD